MTPEAIHHLSQDAVLARIIEQTPVPQPAFTEWANDLYLALLESIVSQQISVKAADAIFRRFRALFADNYPHADQLLQLTTDELRSAGLSGQKIGYLRSVAAFAGEHSLERSYVDKLTDEEIVQYLLPIRGVGRWTVEMLLLFVLDRPDVFPIDDLVIRQRMVRAYPEQTTGLSGRALYNVLHQIADAWHPYRSTASRYLWKWKPEPPAVIGANTQPRTA
jgi:DNA-3-methyladenine glycosylase II